MKIMQAIELPKTRTTTEQRFERLFKIAAPECHINGTTFSIDAKGTVSPLGVYNLNARFSEMPKNFHPLIASTYLASICCATAGIMLKGGRNLMSLGVTDYDSERTITMEDGGKLVITAKTLGAQTGTITVNASVEGKLHAPTDLNGLALYKEVWWPTVAGEFVTEGEGAVWKSNGYEEVPLKVNTKYSLNPKIALPHPQRRTIVENGTLEGLTYTSKIHSFLEKLRF